MYTGPTALRDLRTTEQLVKCLAQGHKKLTQICGTSRARTHAGQPFMYSESDGQFLKKNGFFYIFPNLIKIKKFQEQLIILKGDYGGHFFAQGYFGSQSLHRKKIVQFFVPKRSGV